MSDAPTLEQIMLQGYRDEGRTLSWGEDIGPERMKAMEGREIFTLLGPDGKPHSKILRDFFGTIREKRIESSPTVKEEP